MVADRVGDRVGQAFGASVITAHKPLQFWEFAYHLGDEVGLRQFRRLPRLRGVAVRDDAFARQPLGELRDALDLVGDGAQLFVEGDVLQLLGMLRQRLLLVLFPKEARVGKARGDHLVIARDDLRAAVGRVDVRGADERVRQLAVGAVHDEIFLVHPCGELDDLGRHLQERFVEAAEQRHRPFGQAGILDHQTLVLDQRQARVGRGFGGAVADDRLSLLMVDDDVARPQLFGIVRRRPDGDLAWAVKTMAARREAAGDPAYFARHQFLAEDRDDARQRAHPAQAFAARAFLAPAHRLRPRKAADDRGDRFGQHLGGRAAGLVDHGEIDAVAVLELVLRQAGLAQKAFQRLRRRAAARALQFFADRCGRLGQPLGNQREAARRRPDRQLACFKTRGAQLRAEQFLKLGARAGLHAGGNLFRAQFEKKVGHSVHPGYFSVQRSDWLSIHALQLPFARSRTRAM